MPNPPCCPFIQEVVLTRMNSSGTGLVWSTFLGGDAEADAAFDVAVDSAGRPTVVGVTAAFDYPITPGAYQASLSGPSDGIVARFDPTGSALLYSTFFGGFGNDGVLAHVVDAYGVVTFVGLTNSTNLPTTPGAFDPTYNGGTGILGGLGDLFLARLDMLPTGADMYGASSPGCAGILEIGVNSMPSVGNTSFTVTCTNAPSIGAGVLGIALAPLAMPIPILDVGLWIDPLGLVALLPASGNASGYAQVGISIPNDPALVGGQAYCQFGWFGPNAPAPCPPLGVSASNALQITVQ